MTPDPSTTAPATGPARRLGTSADLPDAYVQPYYLEDLRRRVSVVRVDGALHAFDDLCTCGGTPCSLASGRLDGTNLMCQCHGTVWDVTTGEVRRGPGTLALRTYPVGESAGGVTATVED